MGNNLGKYRSRTWKIPVPMLQVYCTTSGKPERGIHSENVAHSVYIHLSKTFGAIVNKDPKMRLLKESLFNGLIKNTPKFSKSNAILQMTSPIQTGCAIPNCLSGCCSSSPYRASQVSFLTTLLFSPKFKGSYSHGAGSP